MDIPRFTVALPAQPRNRLTAMARPLLIIPHVLLVGGPFLGLMGMGFFRTGALGLVAWLVAILDWFAILFDHGPIVKLQFLKHMYLTWKARVLAYGGFLCDEYPPFGDRSDGGNGAYPATLMLPPEPAQRDKLMVLLRPILVFPHLLLLMLLIFVWCLVMLFVWIWLPLTGNMPVSLWRFSRDVMGYSLRVEAYGLLIHDEFPAFAVFEGAGGE